MEYKCVVKVGSESFKKADTYYHARTLRVLKRKTNYDILDDEVQSVGVFDALSGILNLISVGDGIYELRAVNISRCHETGHTDGWDLKLYPYEEG